MTNTRHLFTLLVSICVITASAATIAYAGGSNNTCFGNINDGGITPDAKSARWFYEGDSSEIRDLGSGTSWLDNAANFSRVHVVGDYYIAVTDATKNSVGYYAVTSRATQTAGGVTQLNDMTLAQIPTPLLRDFTGSQVTVYWSAPTSAGADTSFNGYGDIYGVRLYRKLCSEGSWSTLATVDSPVASPVTSYTDTGVSAGNCYDYALAILYRGGTSSGANDAPVESLYKSDMATLEAQSVSGTGEYSFDSGEVTINFTAESIDTATVMIFRDTYPNTQSTDIIKRYYRISTSGGSFNANLTLSYDDDEIPADGDENTITMERWNGSSWDSYTPNSRDTAGNTITLNGVTTFSRWALGIDGNHPTAVTLSSFRAWSVTDANWFSILLPGAVFVLAGLTLIKWRKRLA